MVEFRWEPGRVGRCEWHRKRRAFFLNALSHDLRAPLNTVVLNAEMLKIVPPEDVKNRVVTIVESAKSAGDYVARLLDFARTGGEEQNRLEPLSLLNMLKHIQQRFAPMAAQKNLFIQIATERDIDEHEKKREGQRPCTALKLGARC